MFERMKEFMHEMKRKLGHSEYTVLLLYPDTLSLKFLIQQSRMKGYKSYSLFPIRIPMEKHENWKLPQKHLGIVEAVIFLLDSRAEEDIKEIRARFWEKVIWDPRIAKLPLAIGLLDAELPGALSPAEITEYLSLIRLTDRFWKVIPTVNRDLSPIIEWIKEIVPIAGRISWTEKRELVEADILEVEELLQAKAELEQAQSNATAT